MYVDIVISNVFNLNKKKSFFFFFFFCGQNLSMLGFLHFGPSAQGGWAVWLYKVCYNSAHCLYGELPSASYRDRHTLAAVATHRYGMNVLRCKRSQFARCFLSACSCAWNGLPECCVWVWFVGIFKGAVNRWCSPRCLFSVIHVLVGLFRRFVKQLLFSHLGLQCLFY